MTRLLILFLAILSSFSTIKAQIGYQVAVVDQSTGKPKANKTVGIKVEILNSEGTIIVSKSQNATTNDFGIVSVQVGNDETFQNIDWNKLPLWVSATVDGVDVGKTQVLTVPVAEHSKHYGSLTPEILASKSWSVRWDGLSITASFSSAGGATITWVGEKSTEKDSGPYFIIGDLVVVYDSTYPSAFIYVPERKALIYLGNSTKTLK